MMLKALLFLFIEIIYIFIAIKINLKNDDILFLL